MTPQPTRRSLLRCGGLLLTSGLAGCASALDHPDLRLRNSDGAEHDLSVEITRDDTDETVLSKTFSLGRKTTDTTVDPLFEEGVRYAVTASVGAGDGEAATWEIETPNPKYHVTVHGSDEADDRSESFLTMGRLGGV